MKDRTEISLVSIIFTIAIIFTTNILYSQDLFEQNKIRIDFISGYDNNPLKISNVSDSIKAVSFVESLQGNLSTKFTLNKNLVTYIDLGGEYTFYPSNSNMNSWGLKTKFKSIYKLYPKYKNSLLPGLYLNAGIDAEVVDKYFTDRVLGEEFESSLPQGEVLKMGDLLDRFSLDYYGELRFRFSNDLNMYLKYNLSNNNYKDLGSIDNNTFVALDNTENVYSVDFDLSLTQYMDLSLYYSLNNRIYDYKIAKGLDKKEKPEKNREYIYHNYGIRVNFDITHIRLSLSYLERDRIDQFEGYYDYNASTIKSYLTYRFSNELKIIVGYSISTKDYENLTLSKKLLSNNYKMLQISIPYKIYKTITIAPAYIYDYEESSYYKFSYRRNYFSLRIRYNLI